MTGLKSIGFDYKFSGILGILAFVISLLAGLIGGVDATAIFFRLLFIVPVFLGLGFGIMQVLKRFVPEAYALLNGSSGDEESGIPVEKEVNSRVEKDLDAAKPREEAGATADKDDVPSVDGAGFSEIDTAGLPRYDSKKDDSLGVTPEATKGKLGTHILKKEEIAHYEPKIMAEAVRTMLRREDD